MATKTPLSQEDFSNHELWKTAKHLEEKSSVYCEGDDEKSGLISQSSTQILRFKQKLDLAFIYDEDLSRVVAYLDTSLAKAAPPLGYRPHLIVEALIQAVRDLSMLPSRPEKLEGIEEELERKSARLKEMSALAESLENELESTKKALSETFDELKTATSQELGDLKESTSQDLAEIKLKTEEGLEMVKKAEEEAVSLNGHTSSITTSKHYESQANTAGKAYKFWSTITVFLGLIVVVIFALALNQDELSLAKIVLHLGLGLGVGGVSFYAGQQAAHFREEQKIFGEFAIQLLTLTPFLRDTDLQEGEKTSIKLALAYQIFLRPTLDESMGNKGDENESSRAIEFLKLFGVKTDTLQRVPKTDDSSS